VTADRMRHDNMCVWCNKIKLCYNHAKPMTCL